MKRNSEHILDDWLVASAQTGNSKALSRLVQRWYPKLLRYANSQLGDPELAQDVCQDTLLHISKQIRSLKDPSAFPRWCYQILQRRCVDSIRGQQRRRRYEVHEGTGNKHASETPVTTSSAFASSPLESKPSTGTDGDHEQSLERYALRQAINKLGPDTARIIRLYYMEGFDTREIASILKVPEGTVKSRLFTARQQLKNVLENP